EFTQPGPRQLIRPQFGPAINFDAGGSQPRRRHQCLPQRLTQAASLNSDFNDHKKRIQDAGWRDGEWQITFYYPPPPTSLLLTLDSAVDLWMKFANPQSAIPYSQLFWALSTVLSALIAALILSSNAFAEEAPPTDAVSVFRCTFGEDWDMNYDGWPDRWV